MAIGLYLYARKTPGQSYIWVLDRIAIVVALGGALIRVGNFFNSEIIGIPTGKSWGVVFQRIDSLPRHPAQLYESLAYFILFLILLLLYHKVEASKTPGILVGTFLILCFSARFLIEFVKENQVDLEVGWVLNMGQRLSIPLILIGVCIIVRYTFFYSPKPPTSKPTQ